LFRVLNFHPDGSSSYSESLDDVGPPRAGTTRWIDLEAQDDASLQVLRERFDFHPLAIEDCAHLDQRPKVEEYRDCLFLVTQGFCPDGVTPGPASLHELHAFLGHEYLVTVHTEPLPAISAVRQRAESDPNLGARGPAFLYYLIADRIVDDNLPVLDGIAEEIEAIEEKVWSTPERSDQERLFAVRRILVQMRRTLAPQRDVFALLSRHSDSRVNESTALYFRDVYDHLTRIHEALEVHRDLLANAQEAYLSAVSNRTNEIMKYLTLMSAIFLPLSFVVGFFGQNFRNLPGFANWAESPALMWVGVLICLGTPWLMLAVFHRKKWL
jgi:magnesium transporter